MKFFIALVIILNTEMFPRIFTYQYVNFPDLKNCENFLLEYQVDLKKSIEGQFPVETINSTAMLCLTQEQITEFTNRLELKKWQQQRRI